jgi:hypothetical protein
MNPLKSAIIQNSRYGVKDRCLEFGVANNRIEIPAQGHTALFAGLGAFTIEFWAYTLANPSATYDYTKDRMIIRNSTAIPFFFLLNNLFAFCFWDGVTQYTGNSATLGQWTHFSCCRLNGNIFIINNSLIFNSLIWKI